MLAILTIGAASASQDVDTLADSTDDSLSVDDIDVVSDGEDEGDDDGDESDYSVDVYVEDNDGDSIPYEDNYEIVTIDAPYNATGNVAVIVDNNEENPAFESSLSDMNYVVDEEDENVYTYTITLSQLNFNFERNTQYSIYAKYFGGNYDDDDDSGTVTFIESDDFRDVPNISIWYPDEYLIGSNDDMSIAIWDELSENVTVLLNDKVLFKGKIVDWEYEDLDGYYIKKFNLFEHDLKLGENTIKVTYDGDEDYLQCDKTETIDAVFMIVENDGDSLFEISLAPDATGTVELFIDGVSYLNKTADELKESSYIDLYLPFGSYEYAVTYKDDEKYSLDEPFTGDFEVSYYFAVGFDGPDEDYEVDIGENVTFGINLVRDAKGPVVISYNGKTIRVIVHDSEDDDDYDEYAKYVTISDLDYGENIITFKYEDDKYPLKTIEKTVNVNPIFEVPKIVKYAGDDLITLVLPQNATGNLVIKKGKYDENTLEWDYDEILATVALVDGKANYSLANMPLGEYNLLVYYDGEDYEDDLEEYVTVNIVPNVNVPECIYNETENAITVILPDDVNDNLTVTIKSEYYDDEFGEYTVTYDEEIYNAVANGTVNVKIPNLPAGDYKVYLTYGENAIFNEDETSYFELEVRDSEPVFDLNVTFPSVVVNDPESEAYWEVSGIPEDADGIIELYINGKLYDDYEAYDVEHNVYDFDLCVFGENTWEVRFVNDKYYKETSKSGKFTFEWISIPEVMNNNDNIWVDLGDKEGYIDFIIDGKAYESEFFRRRSS